MRNLLFVIVVMSVAILSMTCLAQQAEFEDVTPNVAPSVQFSLEGAVPLVGSPTVVLPSPSMQPYFSPTPLGAPTFLAGLRRAVATTLVCYMTQVFAKISKFLTSR